MKKRLEKINLTLKIFVSLSGVALLIASIITPNVWHKPLSYIATILLPFIPDIIKLFGLNASLKLQISYNLFLILAMVLGIDLELYRTFYIFGNPCYDKIIHTLSGLFTAMIAKEILDSSYNGIDIESNSKKIRVKHYDTRFAWFFIVSFVALCAAGWECFEFLHDQITGGHMQELIAPGVADTMWDIIGAMVAGIIVAFPLSKNK